jgi:hypothetical protein
MGPRSHIRSQQAPSAGASLTSRISPAVHPTQLSLPEKSTFASTLTTRTQRPGFVSSPWLADRPSVSPASKAKRKKGKVGSVGQSGIGSEGGPGRVRLLDRISGLKMDEEINPIEQSAQVSSETEPVVNEPEKAQSALVCH